MATASALTGNGVQYIFPTYVYNLDDELTAVTYPSGRKITTTYDAAGRIATVNGQPAGGSLTTYMSGLSYAAHGGVANMGWGR